MDEVARREALEASITFLLVTMGGFLLLTLYQPERALFDAWQHFLLAGLGLAAVVAFTVSGTGKSGRAAAVRESEHPPAHKAENFESATARTELHAPPLSDTAQASVAVLPLENLSELDEDAFLAQGFSAEIVRALYGIPDLRIASYQQSLAYSHLDIQDIMRELDVRYVLSGSIQKVRDQARIAVMLTDAHKKTQIWSESFLRSLDAIFDVQEEIANAVAMQVGSFYLRQVSNEIAREQPQDLSSWGLVQKAMNFWITSYTGEASESTLALLQQAVAQQPDYALAHAELGFIHTQRVMNVFTRDSVGEMAAALAAVNKAYALAPRDPTVMERTGLVWFNCGMKGRSARLMRDLVSLAPYDLVAWGYLANALATGGDDKGVREAKGILARLLANAPRHPSVPFWNFFSATAYSQSGDWEEALEFATAAVDYHPGFCMGWYVLGNIKGALGDAEGAREAELAAQATNPEFTFQRFFDYIINHSAEWNNKEMQYKGLVAAGLVKEEIA